MPGGGYDNRRLSPSPTLAKQCSDPLSPSCTQLPAKQYSANCPPNLPLLHAHLWEGEWGRTRNWDLPWCFPSVGQQAGDEGGWQNGGNSGGGAHVRPEPCPFRIFKQRHILVSTLTLNFCSKSNKKWSKEPSLESLGKNGIIHLWFGVGPICFKSDKRNT